MTDPSDTDRFRDWLERHGDIPRRIACLYAGTEADRADLRQDMLIQLWRSATRFDARCSAKTWIYRVCLNTALTWRRSETRRRRHLGAAPMPDEMLSIPSDSTDRDRTELLYAAIARLDRLERSLILLSLDGLSYREMSEISGLTETNIGAHLTRSRRRLARIIEEIDP